MRDCYLDLFYWMSYVGKGQEQRLHDAWEVIWNEQNSEIGRKNARIFLTQLRRVGHTHCPVGKARSWVMHAPSLVMRADNKGAYWRGGFDSHFRDEIDRLAGASAICLDRQNKSLPPYFVISGTEKKIEAIAYKIGVPLLRNTFIKESTRIVSISIGMPCVSAIPETQNNYLKRMETIFPSEIYEFFPPNSPLRFFVKKKNNIFETKTIDDAIYIAAENDYPICYYADEANQFVSDEKIPLRFEVPLCLCTGHLPKYKQGKRIYSGVPPQLGNFILRQLGQDHFRPKVFWF